MYFFNLLNQTEIIGNIDAEICISFTGKQFARRPVDVCKK